MKVRLVVNQGPHKGKEIAVSTSAKFVIGRGSDCQLRPASQAISKRHCAIEVRDGHCFVEDLQSTNGTFINDDQLTGEREVSPNRFHFDQCKQAIAAGKHVVCEKPLAMTSAETAELTTLAAAAPVVTAVNYNVRFYPLCWEARQRIADGQLGDVYHVTGGYVQDWLLYDNDFNWRVLAKDGGALRAVADIGTHWLDLLTWITGREVEAVCADLRTVHPVRRRPKGSVETFSAKSAGPRETEPVPIGTEDYGSILLRFRGGAAGVCTVSQVTAGRKNCLRYEIAGSRSALAWDSDRPNELWVGHRDRPNECFLRDPALMTPAARQVASYPGGHNEGFPDTFKQLFRAVYEYIEAGDVQAPRPFPTFADGHREVALCEAVLRSHQMRQWVSVVSGEW